ncbi:MAG: hypothetical protein ACM4AI_16110 [Acidobacteriota bacterium]
MEIEAFLERFVEGYLFGDLESMAQVRLEGRKYGNCGYSMVLVELAGAELLGARRSPAGSRIFGG